jgi:hypothetical protein
MSSPKIITRFVYGLIVVLSLAALWLVFNAPANFLNARVVYQGF